VSESFAHHVRDMPDAIDFHAHIYFDPEELEQARALAQKRSKGSASPWATSMRGPLDRIPEGAASLPLPQQTLGGSPSGPPLIEVALRSSLTPRRATIELTTASM
jgi:hypothetical protein